MQIYLFDVRNIKMISKIKRAKQWRKIVYTKKIFSPHNSYTYIQACMYVE